MKPETEIRNLKKQVEDLRKLANLVGVPLLVCYLPELALKQIPKSKKLNKPIIIKSLPLSELKKILWQTRLTKKQVEKNNNDDMKCDYNKGWTDAINKITTKIKWL